MSVTNVPPLSWPSSGKPSNDPDGATSFVCILIVLVGGLLTLAVGHPLVFLAAAVAGGLALVYGTRRARGPVVAHVRTQLLARPPAAECWSAWGDDAEQVRLAGLMCEALAQAKKWPTACFVPDDPLELAFFEVSGVDGSMEVWEVAAVVAREKGRKFEWSRIDGLAKTRTLTLRDLLDAVVVPPEVTGA